MIVDLDKPLYVIDERARYHRIDLFNVRTKEVICYAGTEQELRFPYGTDNITVVLSESD